MSEFFFNVAKQYFFDRYNVKFYYEYFKTHKIELPNTEWNGDRICSLPLFPEMTEDDVDDVVLTIKEVLS